MTETAWDVSDIGQALPPDAWTVLDKMGIHGADFSDLFSVQFSDVLQGLLDVFQGALGEPVRFLGVGAGVLLMLSVFSSMGAGSARGKELREWIGGLFLVTACVLPMEKAIGTAVTAVRTGSGFVCTLIPVLAAIVAASGSPVLSVCWNTAVFSMAQTISAVASGFMAPCCGLVLGTGIFTALSPTFLPADLPGKLRKIATWIFSTLATLFTAFLSLKGILAGSADTLAAKGIKLAVSSFVPVVGSQLSEAYSAVAASVAGVRTSAGAFAVIGVCAVAVPGIVSLVLWMGALQLLQTLSALLGQKNGETLLGAFSSAIRVLYACLLFVTVLYILSLGIILTVKGGA